MQIRLLNRNVSFFLEIAEDIFSKKKLDNNAIEEHEKALYNKTECLQTEIDFYSKESSL